MASPLLKAISSWLIADSYKRDHMNDDDSFDDGGSGAFDDLSPDDLPVLDRTEDYLGGDPLLAHIEGLRSHDFRVRREAQDALVEAGPRALPSLLSLLPDVKPTLREEIAGVLIHIGPDAVPVLLNLLDHPDRDLRELAAWALGEVGDRRARSALQDSLTHDEDEGVRAAAGAALERLG